MIKHNDVSGDAISLFILGSMFNMFFNSRKSDHYDKDIIVP